MKTCNDSYIITTNRLGLREPNDGDIPHLIQMNADAKVMEFFPSIISLDDTLNHYRKIKEHFQEHGFGMYAAETLDNGEFIGIIGLSTFEFTGLNLHGVEIGWRTMSHTWNNGYATEAAQHICIYAFHTLHLTEITSFTAALNKRSEHIMQKLGMTYQRSFNHPKVPIESPLCEHVLYTKVHLC